MNRIFKIVLLLCIWGCSSKSFDSKEELWEYIRKEDHGYLQTKSVNGYDFSLLYKPTDLLVEQELGDDKTIDKVEDLRTKYRKYLYFTLSMSKDNKELLSVTPKSRQEFGAMVNELAFGMGKKVHLLSPKKDTLELLDYVYPRMYGMSRNTSMLFVYPRDEKFLKEDYLSVVIGDLGTYTGEVKFKVPTKLLNNEPRINFK